MTETIPDPFKNYTMKKAIAPALANAPKEIDAETLASIEQMDATALRALIQRVSGAMWGVGIKTPQEIAEAFKLKLAIAGMAEKDMFKALPIMREWFDREMGKAAQSIAMTVENKGISKLSDEKLLRLEQELARMTGQEAIVIAPLPVKHNPGSIS